MKKLSLLFAFVALTATATFAATEPKQDVIKVEFQFDQPSETFTKEIKVTKAITDLIVENTCSVSATWTSGARRYQGQFQSLVTVQLSKLVTSLISCCQ